MEYPNSIRVALLKENYQRTFTASVAFFFLGITLAVYEFDSIVVRQPMVIFGSLIVGIALMRGTIAYLGLRKKISQNSGLPFIHFFTILSSLLWGSALSLEVWHSNADGIQEIVPLMLMLGLASAAPTSLVAMPRLQILFFVSVLLGPASSYFFRILEGTLPNQSSVAPVLLILAFAYFLAASRNVRKMMILNLRNTYKLQAEKEKLRLNTEVRLAQAEKLSSLGEMAGGIAHEINSPLTLLQAYCSQINKNLDQETFQPTRVREIVAKIEKTTLRISKIVRGLKNLSRDGSSDPFEFGIIHELIQDTLSFCTDRITQQGIALSYSPPAQTLYFEGRITELSQVLLNLLNNAVDAIEKIDDKWINISVEDNHPWIEIRVRDCGSGIPPEVVSKIFDPFFTTKGVGKGTGLGLSIAANIIKNHHGELSVDRENRNTCFVIRLPKKVPLSQVA